ncbi:MAG: OmpA family protein [Gammaproteobacteria bacterium]|nr:OmpA family protein [Gammaproteobacteria bacterium]
MKNKNIKQFFHCVYHAMALSFLCIALQVYAADSDKDLYAKSLMANESSLIEYYRNKLAKTYPDTAYGLFAKGWLAGRNGDTELEKKYYEQSVKIKPIATVLNNMIDEKRHSKSEIAKLRKEAMEAAIATSDPITDYYVYSYFKYDVYDTAQSSVEKAQVLDELANSSNWSYRLAAVRMQAEIAKEKGQYQDALNIIRDGTDNRTSADLIYLELDLISTIGQQEKQNVSDIINEMLSRREALIETYSGDHYFVELYYSHLYDFVKRMTKDRKALLTLANLAYDVRHSPGQLDNLYSAYSAVDLQTFKIKLDDALNNYPDFSKIYTYLALYYQNGEQNPQKMREASENALRYSVSFYEKSDYLKWAIDDALNFGMVDYAQGLIEQYGADLAKANLSDVTARLLRMKINLALLQQDFSTANSLIAEMKKQKLYVLPDQEWFTDVGYADAQILKQQASQNPFLTQWDNEFGGAMSLAIQFPVNSAVLPASAYAILDKSANILKRPGGEKYIFRIEGHTDPTGGNKVNIPLSKRRAEATREYLVNKHGIDAARLQAVGLGDVQPVSTNLTEAGRSRNRRVDIRPYGNLSEPSLVTSGLLNTDDAVFSNDGRFVATGQTPITLWDTLYGVRLRELYIGGRLRVFSPNNRYLAVISSATDDRGSVLHALYVTDTKTGLIRSIIPFDASVEGGDLSWSPDGDKLAYNRGDGILGVFDVKHNKLLAARPMSKLKIAARMLWTKDGQHLVVGQAQRKVLDFYDPTNLTKIKSVEGVDFPHGIGESDDGSVLLVANNDNTLSIFDRQSFQLLDRVPLETPVPENIYAIPGTTKVVMDAKFQRQQMTIFDYQNKTWEQGVSTKNNLRVGAYPDGDQLWAATDNSIVLFGRDDQKVSARIDSASDAGRQGLQWDKTRDYLFSQDEAGANIWQVSQARLVHRIEEAGTRWHNDSENPSHWWSLSATGELLKFSTENFTMSRFPGVSFEVDFAQISGKYLVAAEKPQLKTDQARIAVFDISSQKKLYEFSVDLVTAPLRYGAGVSKAGIKAISIAVNRNLLALSSWWRDGNWETVNSSNIQLFNLKTGQSAGKDVVSSSAITALDFDNTAANDILVSDQDSRYIMHLNNGKRENSTSKDWKTLTMENGQTIKFSSFHMESGAKKRYVKDKIVDLVADSKRNVLIAQSVSNVLTYYSLDTLEPRLFVYFKKQGEWLATDTRGFFASSLNGTKDTYWSLGDNFLPFDDLKDKFESERALKESLAAVFSGEKPIAPQPIIEPDMLDAPFKVVLISDATASTQAETYKLTMKINKKDKHSPDPTIYYLVNGRKSRGFDSDPFADLDESLTFVRTIPLGVGSNKIEAIVQYKGVDVHKELVEINRTENRQTQLSENTLWFFGVGVSEYANKLQNLDFADRDAQELEKAFLAQKGKLFNDVKTKVLVNGGASAREIKIQLYDFLAQAKPEDNIVIFIAGHGVQDSSQALYFMPHDGDISRPFTGMSMDDFKNFLDQRPINQKALFLMDICHAGAFDNKNSGRLSSEDVIKKLTSGTATTVFSSSSGAQQSLEDESFGGGHGAFTYALLQAIRGAADKQTGDEDGMVSLMEMIFYTKKEVAKITNKAQQPTVPVLSNFKDYPLASSL